MCVHGLSEAMGQPQMMSGTRIGQGGEISGAGKEVVGK